MADYWVAQRTDYWAVRRDAATRDEEVFRARGDAFDRAHELVRTSGGGDVIVQGLDGRIARTAVRPPDVPPIGPRAHPPAGPRGGVGGDDAGRPAGDAAIIRHRRLAAHRTPPASRVS